ncbi:MAG: 23S rRNA (adenine(2030)-N(6))-methyltransferase RlmJ [Betaproteobacteria bacterium]|nr:MAG: 23S rRNA (adenine(2030)-N(6))-methyltransferase RlmJ [Betaproteobacteria bacterium]
MLGYRHAFHAGNHADVLKHLVLVRILRHMNQKEKPYWYIDTHAGAGLYGLDSGYATKNAEHEQGINRLWSVTDLPEPLTDFVDLLRDLNPRGRLTLYPGSPYIAQKLLRPIDKMRLFEMHTTDIELLGRTFHDGRRVVVTLGDGFAGLKSSLPPPPRRAVVLIDPSYEDKADYARVPEALKDSLKRFATGTYIIWYPLLGRADAQRLPERLRSAAKALGAEWLDVNLQVYKPVTGETGMHGSGLFIVNPPWTLEADLRVCMPVLASLLAQGSQASFNLERSKG